MNRAEIVKLAKEGLLSTHELTAAIIEMAEELESNKTRHAALYALAGPGYSRFSAKSVEAFIAERIERLEQQVAEARQSLAGAGMSLIAYDKSYGGGGGEDEAREIATMLGDEEGGSSGDIEQWLRHFLEATR